MRWRQCSQRSLLTADVANHFRGSQQDDHSDFKWIHLSLTSS